MVDKGEGRGEVRFDIVTVSGELVKESKFENTRKLFF